MVYIYIFSLYNILNECQVIHIFQPPYQSTIYNPIIIAFNDNFVFNPKTPGLRGLALQGVGLWRVYEHDAVGQNFRMPEMFGVPVVPVVLGPCGTGLGEGMVLGIPLVPAVIYGDLP